MSGEGNRPYTITPTRMVMDNRFAGADAAAAAVGSNVVQVTPVRPFASEERPRAGRIVVPAHRGAGRNPRATSYVDYQQGINSVFIGLVIRSYETR